MRASSCASVSEGGADEAPARNAGTPVSKNAIERSARQIMTDNCIIPISPIGVGAAWHAGWPAIRGPGSGLLRAEENARSCRGPSEGHGGCRNRWRGQRRAWLEDWERAPESRARGWPPGSAFED